MITKEQAIMYEIGRTSLIGSFIMKFTPQSILKKRRNKRYENYKELIKIILENESATT